MPFKKGDPKPEKSGRDKGTPNKTTEAIKEKFALAIQGIDIRSDLMSLTPEQRLKILPELAKFILPQPKTVEISGEINAYNSRVETLYAALQQQSGRSGQGPEAGK